MRALIAASIALLPISAIADEPQPDYVRACAAAYRSVSDYPWEFEFLTGFSEAADPESVRVVVKYVTARGVMRDPVSRTEECLFRDDELVSSSMFIFVPIEIYQDTDEFKLMRAAAEMSLREAP